MRLFARSHDYYSGVKPPCLQKANAFTLMWRRSNVALTSLDVHGLKKIIPAGDIRQTNYTKLYTTCLIRDLVHHVT